MNYWCSSHIIPKGIIKAINSLCGSILWHGNLDSGHSARVAWSEVVKLKTEGGLGLPDLILWNKACLLKLIHLLFSCSGSLWVAWFTKRILQGNLHQFWLVKPKQSHSFVIKKLLNLRHYAYDWIKVALGNGQKCSFWADNWTPLGKLLDYLSPQGPLQLGIPLSATVSSLWRHGSWSLPPARSDSQLYLHIHLSEVNITDEPDTYTWALPGLNPRSKTTTGAIYRQIRTSYPQVPWSTAVWFSKGIPRHQFHCWLSILNRNPTRDRLLSWHLSVPPTCLLCNSLPESRDHLYFDCSFSWRLWEPLSLSLSLNSGRSWTSSLHGIISQRGNKSYCNLAYLVWQASLYLIWSERNNRLHRNIFKSPESLLPGVDLLIRNRISSLREESPRSASAMYRIWTAGAQQRT